ncbi:MAG: corrinoid protein [Desulfobacterales bacterium]|jgi:corrinoid protein of di/trimethylamine methyltransferase
MEKSLILDNLANAVIAGKKDLARDNAQAAIDNKIDPLEALEQGISKGMLTVGEKFESGESYLPELIMAADVFNAAMEILKPAIEANQTDIKKSGTLLLATVKGDVHNLGKNIVATVMETHGFEVVDLGVDQPTLDIIDAAQANQADVIGLSAVMTTTMPYQKELIDTLQELKIREQFIVLVGGGPINQQWADEIGADGYGETAMDAVNIATQKINAKKAAVAL